MTNPRRRFVKALVAGAMAPTGTLPLLQAAEITPWHEQFAKEANLLADGQTLRLLIPNGSAANVKIATDEFTRLSGVNCQIEEVAVDDINVELILRKASGDNSIDVALPATFGLVDLVQAKAVLALDTLAEQYEPEGFSDGYLYRAGDDYKGQLFGYQTDGDAYLLFYNKMLMEDVTENSAYRKLTGSPLAPATSWEELDRMMAFFHRPSQNLYGGSLFRNPGYLVWEWWARFHAKGYLPFTQDMQANINNAAGVEALEQLIAASDSLTPGSRSNGLFENWADFARGNVFCNIGWGGTQKYLMSQQNMRDNLIHSALPGPMTDGRQTSMGYFNWGWNYTVSSQSAHPELAYLLALFCVSPAISTKSVGEADGFFDPFRDIHYEDPMIEEVYGASFLNAHRESLVTSIPDLYISGQSNYLDVLRQQILAALNGELTAQQALNICAREWSHITRRLGRENQVAQWQALADLYPASFQ